ncbi:MAG: hypothetical protein U9N53_08340 [Bacteroidota bacterium]|nr:hypothetical protein [Bacteroidota bacterium]
MNKHVFLDNLTAAIGALLAGKKKFFAKSIISPSFEEHLKSIEIKMPEINKEGTYDINAKTLVGMTNPAFKVAKWIGHDYPTIIYHHGNNERPFDFNRSAKNTFANIFIKTKEDIRTNLIVVRAPFHNNSLKVYQEKMTELKNFTAMIAVSVKLNEEIISVLRKKNNTSIITSGISLGGWVTNLHRSFYNTSTAYVPLLAGTFLGELFLKSKYKKLTSKLALQQPKKIRELLNFNNFYKKIKDQNVFPLLARYDQFIEYDVEKVSYEGYILKTIEGGHVTGSLETKEELRYHILEVLNNILEI